MRPQQSTLCTNRVSQQANFNTKKDILFFVTSTWQTQGISSPLAFDSPTNNGGMGAWMFLLQLSSHGTSTCCGCSALGHPERADRIILLYGISGDTTLMPLLLSKFSLPQRERVEYFYCMVLVGKPLKNQRLLKVGHQAATD